MRRTAIPILVLGAGLVAAVNAGAQTPGNADVRATISFDKTVNVVENIGREKAVFISVSPMMMTPGIGEAAAVAVVGNREGNYELLAVGSSENGLDVYPNRIEARLTNAIIGNSGVIHVNQDVGTMSNQANLLAIGQTLFGGMADSQAEAEQYNIQNRILTNGGALIVAYGELYFSTSRKANLVDSVNFNLGNVSVNQNAGEFNNQTNAAAVGVGSLGTQQLGEAALGQTTAANNAQRAASQHTATINNSMNTNLAQLNVNQAAGAMTSQSSTFNFSATFSFGANELTVPPATYRQFQ